VESEAAAVADTESEPEAAPAAAGVTAKEVAAVAVTVAAVNEEASTGVARLVRLRQHCYCHPLTGRAELAAQCRCTRCRPPESAYG